jgi:hypothetical protein
MKTIAIALGALLASAAASAFAEVDRNTPYDPEWVAREQAREAWRNNYGYDEYRGRDERWRDERWRDGRNSRLECWNPRARHFEGVREGEYQDDLDFSRCRQIAEGYSSRRWR